MFLILVQWLYMTLIFNESTSISFGKLLEREKGEREREVEKGILRIEDRDQKDGYQKGGVRGWMTRVEGNTLNNIVISLHSDR